MAQYPSKDVTAQRREIGMALRRAREAIDLSGLDLARHLGWTQTRLSRVESGVGPASETEVAMHLCRCHADPEEINRLRQLARLSEDRYRMQRHSDRSADELTSLSTLESNADGIISFEPNLIPGVLQTEAYARALLEWPGVHTPQGVESRVVARRRRRRLLGPGGPGFRFYVSEHALRTVVGSPAVMHWQLHDLLGDTAGELRTLRMIPRTAGPCGTFGSAFWFMEFPKPDAPVIYVQNWTTSLFLDEKPDIAAYREVLRVLDRVALDERESREWIARIAYQYRQTKGGS